MSDAKQWVTVRVPESDREQAEDYKPDDATWGDCLVAGAKHLSDDSGVELYEMGNPDPVDRIQGVAADLAEQYPDLDADELARKVAMKIDYAELATRTADELEGRLRR